MSRPVVAWLVGMALVAALPASTGAAAELPVATPSMDGVAAAVPPAPSPTAAFERTEAREDCAEYEPLRRPFFGDTHVHTAFSFDAAGQGTRNSPRDAYRFARGEALGIQPYDRDDRPIQMVQLRRPLDFAIVTDHSDLLGETRICAEPGAEGYDSLVCWIFRRWPKLAYAAVNSRTYGQEVPSRYSFCGPNGKICRDAAVGPWREIQDAAEEAYDRTASCDFTSFVGYEWTGMPAMANIHRNVIFRNDRVQPFPTTYIETPTPEGLWESLDATCLSGSDGCDVLAIPHNSNVSRGRMFQVETSDGSPLSRAWAERRAALEPLVEVTQHKGDSECRPGGPTADELCGYEKLPYDNLGGAHIGGGPPPPGVHAREALGRGLEQWVELGVNPFAFGLIGSTDTHFGTPGMVAEDRFVGHAAGKVSRRLEIPVLPDDILYNPGGLAVLWAEENSRDALFAAMRRREAYGTSGPRMVVRFFGGWDHPAELCGTEELVSRGYAGGVPMGGELRPPPSGSDRAPSFIALALKDPGTAERPGTDLQRLQVIKVSLDESGDAVEQIHDVAGDAGAGADFDARSCRAGSGAASLCAVWTDPEFDPERPALYYLRVLESPSCRWSQYVCNAAGVDCAQPATRIEGLEACCDPGVPITIQERAWSSPIWYTPRRL